VRAGYASLATPLGTRRLCIATRDGAVAFSALSPDEPRLKASLRAQGWQLNARDAIAREAAAQARAYFAKRLRRFDLPLHLAGTPLECDAWRAVAALEAGALVSYADVARAIGRPHSHRGVARAMARTPLDLFVPAHRVLGSDGTIKGDAAQTGLRRLLLAFEGYAVSRSGRVRSRLRDASAAGSPTKSD
jgi:methylated-DNA-[protein]-cysteine S-methyltransferase